MAFTFQGQRFESVALARLVATLGLIAGTYDVGTCDWTIVAGYDEDGYPFHGDCGAELVATADRWACTAGHEHVSMEARFRERWDYAEDAGEAAAMAAAGVEPRDMAGRVFIA